MSGDFTLASDTGRQGKLEPDLTKNVGTVSSRTALLTLDKYMKFYLQSTLTDKVENKIKCTD